MPGEVFLCGPFHFTVCSGSNGSLLMFTKAVSFVIESGVSWVV